MAPAKSREEGRRRVQRLVERFARRYDYYRSPDYDEASTRAHFIDPFFAALGWDVGDEAGLGPGREVVVENRFVAASEAAGLDDWDEDLSTSELAERAPRVSKPDYLFRPFGRVAFVAEAKKPSIGLRGKAPAFQVKSYAWTLSTPMALLTDFAEFRVFDASGRPEYDHPGVGRLAEFDLTYTAYVDQWDLLWGTFSREAVTSGGLDQLVGATRRRVAGALRVDESFLAELERWRETLANDIAARNLGLDRWQLAEATQRILDRVVFIRVCEDRQVEPAVVLRRYARMKDAYRNACREFRRLDAIYNGVLFSWHWSEDLEVSDSLFQRLVASLYFPTPYRFDVIGADLLGSVYERFLGKELDLADDGGVILVDKPETRHAGGVYYTPQWVVEFIVDRTIGPLLEGKTPRAAANLRIVDPACGSGAFLLGAFDYLIRWHERYFTERPSEGRQRHFEGSDGIRHLTSDAKAEILSNCIFGVDIDPQAVEVTQMSLYLKVLEGENAASLAHQQRLFKAPYLPPLDKNIRCGNSLLATSDVSADVLFDFNLARRVNPFDWETAELGFGDVFAQRGGFDAVIGNPPYTRTQVLRQYRPEETDAYAAKFLSASEGSFDIAAPFIEHGLALLRPQGRLGYIVSRQFCEADYGRPLRNILAGRVEDIVDFRSGMVFENASAYTLILIARSKPVRQWRLTRVPSPPSAAALGAALDDTTLSAERPGDLLGPEAWDLPLPAEEALLERLASSFPTLGDVSGGAIFQGVVTGADYVFRLVDHGPSREDRGMRLVARRDDGESVPVPVEKTLLRPVLAGRGDIRRFAVAESSEVLLLPYERDREDQRYELISRARLQSEYPGAFNWLEKHEAELRARTSGEWNDLNWYGYSRRQNLELWDEPKVLVPYMVEDLCAHFDTARNWFVNVATGGYGIAHSAVDDPEFLAALLSSRLLSWVLARYSREWRGGWHAARKGNLVRLPVAEPGTRDRAHIKELFARCVAATDAVATARLERDKQVAARLLEKAVLDFDNTIDHLYGISDRERTLFRSA